MYKNAFDAKDEDAPNSSKKLIKITLYQWAYTGKNFVENILNSFINGGGGGVV